MRGALFLMLASDRIQWLLGRVLESALRLPENNGTEGQGDWNVLGTGVMGELTYTGKPHRMSRGKCGN
jgi:hypothetical protein